jgi:Tfp pilus assembly protein PilO
MSEHLYLISLFLFVGTPLAIFGMKYWSATQQAKARLADEGAYRKLAADAATAQSGNAATLSAIQSELSEIKTRMASVERILKEVE